MLVYGDQIERCAPEARAREINCRLDGIERLPAGLDRHARLVAALIETGSLLQGVADADFDLVRADRRIPSTGALDSVLQQLAAALCRSWDSGYREIGAIPRIEINKDWPSDVGIRNPEGYAFYAVYPEAYVEAARRLELKAAPRVIGIRSIGTSLAAVVAAALDASRPVTVRPFGNPSARSIAIDQELERELLDGDAHYVIVDEGPGVSGSSFGAVADWLQARGVPLERIALLPSHAGPPGPASTAARRQWWRQVQRQSGELGNRWPELIQHWCAGLLGSLDDPPQEISGGKWRLFHYIREADWPPVVSEWERRKFLVRSGGKAFLVKFAGLGRTGEEKLAIAQVLHSEGMTPQPLGLIHGFLIERWCDGAAAVTARERPLAEIGRYIGTRARLLPAMSSSGASVAQLLTMTRRNISLEFGDRFTGALERWERRASELQRRIVRVRTDNKMDAQEWLRSSSGELIKTDALDHHCGHDLIGCQDPAWDCAGAIVEFDLREGEDEALVEAAELAAGKSVDRELLDFYHAAYLAFRLGQATLGADIVASGREQLRLKLRGDRYAAELQHLLESTTGATQPESLVG